jgi:hypothetical protein
MGTKSLLVTVTVRLQGSFRLIHELQEWIQLGSGAVVSWGCRAVKRRPSKNQAASVGDNVRENYEAVAGNGLGKKTRREFV